MAQDISEDNEDYLHNNEPVSKPKSVHHKCDVRTVWAFGTIAEDKVAAGPINSMQDANFMNKQ